MAFQPNSARRRPRRESGCPNPSRPAVPARGLLVALWWAARRVLPAYLGRPASPMSDPAAHRSRRSLLPLSRQRRDQRGRGVATPLSANAPPRCSEDVPTQNNKPTPVLVSLDTTRKEKPREARFASLSTRIQRYPNPACGDYGDSSMRLSAGVSGGDRRTPRLPCRPLQWVYCPSTPPRHTRLAPASPEPVTLPLRGH